MMGDDWPRHKTLVGASGAEYRYYPLEDHEGRKPFAGNYAIVALQGGVLCSVILVGQTDNLPFVARAILPAQVHNYKATHIFLHANDAKDARLAEVEDLIRAYDPVANRA